MKILICGSAGQLGSDCSKVLGPKHEVTGVDIGEIDITDPASVERVIARFSPDIVVNCAAYTNVDACETEKALARKVNVDGPANLASAMDKHGGRLIHVSTDYVFDGRKKPPASYSEKDEPNPLSYYGKTKLEGEAAVQEAIEAHVIVRTAWMYGAQGRNFLKTMLRLSLANPQKELRVVNDQFGSPTWSYRLAVQIDKLIHENCQGTFHATAQGHCTWYELARYFLEKMDVSCSLVPCSSEEYPTPATRPKNSILENGNLNARGIDLMAEWRDDVDMFVSNFREALLNEAVQGTS